MKEYFKTSIIWHKSGQENNFGERADASTSEIKCRLEYGMKAVRNIKGETVSSDALIITDQKIGILDQLEIEGRKYKILTYYDNADLDNNFLTREIYI